ncbi:RNA polymerase, sigma 54 subunit, RpoN/SigL [Paenibacillaceae bacterium GAS479]|nr:RNA polymerase, sigma 54 subunit, RpoN/SigL [Paenibacillaceae bacterium GAS479]
MNVPALQQHGLLRQEQHQRLALTQEMRQSLALLSMPAIELDRCVRELAADNPLLEYREAPALRGLSGRRSASAWNAADPLDRAPAGPQTLEAELLGQLRLLGPPAPLRRAAGYLAGNLDESGYLALSLEEAAQQLGITAELAAEALRLLQSLQPAGIGARSLRECLLLQLDRGPRSASGAREQRECLPQQLDRDPQPAPGVREQRECQPQQLDHELQLASGARELADRWLPQLAERKWDEISEGTGMSRDEVEAARLHLRGLDPRPGLRLSSARTESIIADARVGLTADSELSVELNTAWEPRLSLAGSDGFLAGVRREHEAYAYIEGYRSSARSLLNSLATRRQTLRKVVEAIFIEQQAFLQVGWSGLRPLTMANVALVLGVHESTVSRAVADKYVRTPHGVFSLKAFFSATLGRGGSEEVSAVAARQRLAALIAAESRSRPLSDQQLAKMLSEEGVPLSRRTVAKYRDELRIPCSTARRDADARVHAGSLQG